MHSCRLAVLLSFFLSSCAPAVTTPAAAPPAAPAPEPPPAWKVLYDTSAAPPVSKPVAGAFTSKGAHETAELRGGRLVITRVDGRIVAQLALGEDTLVEVGDLDMDGDNELLVVGHAGGKTTARLLQADGGEIAAIYEFTALGETCGSAVLSYRLTARGLDFHADTKPQPCPNLSLEQRAKRLHDEAIVIDTHDDITSAILESGFDIGKPNGKTHTDLPKMRAGGVTGEFFAIFVDGRFYDRPTARDGGAARRALDMIDVTYRQIERYPDDLVLATTAADIRAAKRARKIAVLMGIEGGHAIENSLPALRDFYRLGVRYMTLTHTRHNDWADSSGFGAPLEPRHHGLTAFGDEVVREMQRIGMLVDVSHVSDATFDAVMRVAKAPVIASHSSARALADVPRNLDDDRLRAVGKNGGVVMINFFDGFLDAKYAAAMRDLLTKHGKEIEAMRAKPLTVAQRREAFAKLSGELPKVRLSALIDHIEHVAKVAGVDHVGLGSDFDGVDAIPEELGGIDGLPKITRALLERGWSDDDVRKVLGENLLRVMEAAEAYARATQTSLSGDGSLRAIE